MRRTRWLHQRRGTTYEEIGTATGQWSLEDAFPPHKRMVEGKSFTVHRSEYDGSFWVRPTNEFRDGRFRMIYHEEDCPGHVASRRDPNICERCNVHTNELRPDEEQ